MHDRLDVGNGVVAFHCRLEVVIDVIDEVGEEGHAIFGILDQVEGLCGDVRALRG